MDDEDAFGAKVAMDYLVAVRVPDGVGNLADKVQARCEGQRLAALAEVVVEANFIGFAAEEDRGTEVMFNELFRAENARVFEALQNSELLESRAAGGFVGGSVFTGDGVDPDAAGDFGGRVLGLEVLAGEERVFFDEFLENVVAHLALTLRRADSGFLERLRDAARGSCVDIVPAAGFIAVIIALEERGDDSGAFVARFPFADAHAF
jgi:hypothetical protein